MPTGLVMAAVLIAHALGIATWATRVILPSALVFVAPALLVATEARDPWVIAALLAYVAWVGTMMNASTSPRLAIATTFSAALFVDAAAFFTCGHPVVAVELAAAAPFVRRLVVLAESSLD